MKALRNRTEMMIEEGDSRREKGERIKIEVREVEE